MEPNDLLPKRVVNYINAIGVRSMDHLADRFHAPAKNGDAGEGAEGMAPKAVQTLVDYWQAMTAEDKQEFVGRVAGTVVEVVAASAALPFGLKLGKKVMKATGKVVKREAKRIRKAAKAKDDAKPAAKGKSKPKKSPKSAEKPKSRAKITTKQKAS